MSVINVSFTNLIKNDLFCDYISNFHRLREFFRGDPKDDRSYEDVIREVKLRCYSRRELVDILSQQNSKWGASSSTMENLEKFRHKNCCAVVTGQQMGLFGGPLYTQYKAISCIRLCRILEEKFKVPFVPLFWIESEDHDFKEAASIHIVCPRGELQEITYEQPERQDRLPMSSLILDENICSSLAILSESLPSSVYKENLLQKLSECFSPGTKYLDAFARWMHYIFTERGLILISPSDRRIKELIKKVFLFELQTAPASCNLLKKTSQILQSSGYHSQIRPYENRVNLYYLNPARSVIDLEGSVFRIESSGKEMNREGILELAESHSEDFSHNVAMRPIVQDYLLPTVVYVGGPAEVAYWAQFRDLHRHFGIPAPLVFPRVSITILEGSIARLLRKYDVKAEDLLHHRGELLREKLLPHLPQDFKEEMDNTWEFIRKSLFKLAEEAATIDVNLQPAFRRFMGKMERQWDLLSRKASNTYGQRNDIIKSHYQRIESSLFPCNDLQERSLNIVQYYVKYGETFLERLFLEPDITSPWAHQILEF